MGFKMAPTCTTLNLAYLEENLYEIKIHQYKNRIHEIMEIYFSYSENAHGVTLTIYIT